MPEEKIAYVFPGQGSQMVGMGRDLYQESTLAREIFEEADDTLGISLSRLCFEGPEEELTKTINAQPAIFTVSIVCLKILLKTFNQLICPVFMAGHSLGEYTALVAAEVLDFKDGLRLVRKRGELMQEAGKKNPGGMAAILGLDEFSAEQICQETGTQIANINSPGQIVISGAKDPLVRAMDLAKAMGAKYTISLRVGGAFHSSLMQSAAEGLDWAISQFNFSDPNVPIVANCSAQPLTTAAEIKDELVIQLSSCIQWQKSVEYMADAGVSTFIEVGPGEILSGLVKRTVEKEVVSFNDLFPSKG